MAEDMREDVRALLKSENMHVMGASRKAMDAALSNVSIDESVRLVSVGEVSIFHQFVPAPEQGSGVMVISESGIALGWRCGFTNYESYELPWEALVRANVSISRTTGMIVDVADANLRFMFQEPLRSQYTKMHADLISAILGKELGVDQKGDQAKLSGSSKDGENSSRRKRKKHKK